MTDDHQWQAPGQPAASPPPPPAPPIAPAAYAAPPAYSASPAYTAPPVAPPGWTPPPKPGLIPLRPMTLGTILGAAFQTLRRNPSATLAPALILTIAVGVIQVLGSTGFLASYLGAVTDLTNDPQATFDPSTVISPFIGYAITVFVSALLSLIITAIVDAIVTVQVASSTLGARLRLRGLWRRLRGRRGAVIGWAALTGAAVLVAWGVVILALVGIGLTGSAGVVIAVLLGVLLAAGLAVVSAWLWVKLGFVPAAIVLERTSIAASMRRSWRLTNGAFWRTFGIRVLVVVMIAVATSIITTPVSFVISIMGGVLQPNGSTAASMSSTLIVSTIATQAVTAVISAVGLVITTATTALLYLDQRMRQEGLDLDLARFVERRAAGEQGLADPYLPKPAA
ncbi:MAG TPA: hypothetical protein VFQ74_10675 [Pseudolysinimonas sp.]|nr:hypothetical protein [Pseudolysinimonas sp.]